MRRESLQGCHTNAVPKGTVQLPSAGGSRPVGPSSNTLLFSSSTSSSPSLPKRSASLLPSSDLLNPPREGPWSMHG